MTTRAPVPTGRPASEPALEPDLVRELASALRAIRFGTIELVIHEGRVVQLERREKVRLEHGRRHEARQGIHREGPAAPLSD